MPDIEEKRCDLCDTVVETSVDGRQYRFTAHDEQFCRAVTKHRIAMLEACAREASARSVQVKHDACLHTDRLVLRVNTLESALNEALEIVESHREDQRCSSDPTSWPDLERLRDVLEGK